MDVSHGQQNLSLFSMPKSGVSEKSPLGVAPSGAASLPGVANSADTGAVSSPSPFQQQIATVPPTAVAPLTVVAQPPQEGDFTHALQDQLLESAKKKKGMLEMLSQWVGSGTDLIQNSKPLAFLHNQLSEIPAQEIPNLVAKNPFITKALAMGVQDFMESPQPLGALLDMLELPKPELGDTGMSIPLEEKITPKAFLKGLGIDPHMVVAALSTLESRLPVEGLQPYMVEATRQQIRSSATMPTGTMGNVATRVPLQTRNVDFDPFADGKDISLGLTEKIATNRAETWQPSTPPAQMGKIDLDSWIATMPAKRERMESSPFVVHSMDQELASEELTSDLHAPYLQSQLPGPLQALGIDKVPFLSLEKSFFEKESKENPEEERDASAKHTAENEHSRDSMQIHTSQPFDSKLGEFSHPASKAILDTIADKVLEKAEVMLHGKHNTAVIDVKSAEGENIRLAVKITDSKVEMRIISTSEKVLENLARNVEHLQNSMAERKLHLADVKFSKENPFSQNHSSFANFQDRNSAQHRPLFELEDWKQGGNARGTTSISNRMQVWNRSNFIPAPTVTSGQRVQLLI